MTFQRNPLNDDLVVLKNATAIARSVKNIVFTQPGEKFFDEDFGSRVSRFLFENIDPVTASNIRDEIVQSILNYEPRVTLTDVRVVPDYDGNAMNATIQYSIIGADIPPQSLDLVLLPTR
jgi:phage baseplate assembly protein W|tara:strand:+ start:3070 stop:3429 length:360 start_codon:yes stop_codon:yes gene_type:complete